MHYTIPQPPYAAATGGFLGLPQYDHETYMQERSKFRWGTVVISGVCVDALTTNRSGAREAPNAIRSASMMNCEINAARQVIDIGNVVPDMRAQIAGWITDILRGLHYPVTLGGDHSITLDILKAMAEFYNQPIPIVHFDAHPDTWPENWGTKKGHGNFLYEALRSKYVDGRRSAMIGLRSSMDSDIRKYTYEKIGLVRTANDVHSGNLHELAVEIARRTEPKSQGPQTRPPTYLTFDIDALDPAFAPGTGTPEIGGLATWQVMNLIRHPAMQRINWVGMDLVEVLPAYDHAQLTTLAASQIVLAHIEGLSAFS